MFNNKLRIAMESVIDPTRESLDPSVFDITNGEYVIKDSARGHLVNIVNEIDREIVKIKRWFIKGSILSYQWLDWTDIDILLEVDERLTDKQMWDIRMKIKDYDEIELVNTNHPLQFYVLPGAFQTENANGIYDVENRKWVRGPYNITVNVDEYMDKFRAHSEWLDATIAELERDLMDYFIYQSLTKEERDVMSSQIVEKLDEINDSVDTLLKYRKDIKDERRDAFDFDMSPEEIRKYGTKNKLPENVVYKMLERYRYMAVLRTLEKIRKEELGNKAEVELIKNLFGLPSEGRPW